MYEHDGKQKNRVCFETTFQMQLNINAFCCKIESPMHDNDLSTV